MMTQATPYIVPYCTTPVGILYQDNDLLIIRKPNMLLSVPGRHPLNHDCVISRIQRHFPTARTVHRLDLDTSGLMIIPMSKEIQAHIGKQFEGREIEKTYTAILDGVIADNAGKIELPIITDWPNRPRQKVCHETGKWALTLFEVLERDIQKNVTRVKFKPITGRSHQLRIHARELGHPILGCDLYAHTHAYEKSARLLLHATSISFSHPRSGKTLYFEDQVPF